MASSQDCHRSLTSPFATADALAVATFVSANRLGYPPARSQREKLLGRLDALIALSEETRVAAEERFPGDYRVLSPGVDAALFFPAAKRRQIVVELRPDTSESWRAACCTRHASCPTGRSCCSGHAP